MNLAMATSYPLGNVARTGEWRRTHTPTPGINTTSAQRGFSSTDRYTDTQPAATE